jgi:hypothetical protein
MTQNSKGESNFQVAHRIRDIGVYEILMSGARATIKDRHSSILARQISRRSISASLVSS